MKLKKYLMVGIASLSLGTVGVLGSPSNVSAHTWWDGTPKAVRGSWRTKNVYSNYMGVNHATFKATAHKVEFAYSASSNITLRKPYWRKVGPRSYTVHGEWLRDGGYDHRITIKKLGYGYIRAYFDGQSITKGSPFPNLFRK